VPARVDPEDLRDDAHGDEGGDVGDLVIFELSGSAPSVGFADVNERFEVSVLGGAGFSSFVEVVPVNTGFLAPHDASLSAYAVEVDLANFGFAPGETTGSVRIRLVDHLVTRSADPTAIGALNSMPIPEPDTGFLMGIGLAGLAIVKRRRMPARRKRALARLEVDGHRPRAFPRATRPVGAYLAGASHRPGIAESGTEDSFSYSLRKPHVNASRLFEARENGREDRRKFREFAANGPSDGEAETAAARRFLRQMRPGSPCASAAVPLSGDRGIPFEGRR
jgi:hypothetical protein